MYKILVATMLSVNLWYKNIKVKHQYNVKIKVY